MGKRLGVHGMGPNKMPKTCDLGLTLAPKQEVKKSECVVEF